MRVTKRIDNKKTALLLQAAKKKLRWTQKQIAGKSGLNQSQVSRLLKGQSKRRARGIDAICKTLNVEIAYTGTHLSLEGYPALSLCLSEVLDGSKKRERAVVQLLKSARNLR